MNFLVNASPPKPFDVVRCIGHVMVRALGNISCDRSNSVFSCKCIFSLTVGCSNIKLCWCIGHMMLRVVGSISCALDPKVKVK